ncbi:hypothetical protein ACUSIJ_25125 [Pseudochelatococcus sp. B33]
MADSDITVTSLTATGGVGVIVIAPVTGGQSCLPYLQLAAVEIWEASSNNRNVSAYIGDTVAGLTRQGLAANTTRYYWARARDVSGNLGDWFPPSATGGMSASTSSAAPGPNSVGPGELQDNAVTTPKLNGGAVTNAKLGALSVGSANMQNAAIDTAHIVNAAITRAKIGSAAVGTANIEDLAVTSAKINSLAANKITAGTLVAGVVYSGTVNASQVNASSLSAISANLGTITAGILSANVSYLGTVAASNITAGFLATNVTYTGTLNASQINAGELTGITIQTAPSGHRVAINQGSNNITITNAVGQIDIGGNTENILFGSGEGGVVAHLTGLNPNPEIPVLHVQNFSNGGIGALFNGTGAGNTSHCIRAQTLIEAGGSIVLGVSQGGGGWAAFAERGNYGPFTGGHDAFVAKDESTEVGDIVCDFKVIARNGVDDTVTEVYVAEDEADPAAVGVVSRRVAFDPDSMMGALPQKEGRSRLREILAERYDRLAINSVGEGQVNVCGRGGNIRAGDLIMTSTLRGKGQRQPDGIVRNYTVAKAREDVTFASPDSVKRCACIYLAG